MTAPTNGTDWSQPEMVRAIQRIERTQAETLSELRAQRSEYLHRDVYHADQKSLADYKSQVAVDIVNLEAEQARIRKDVRDSQRYALTLAVSIAGVVAGVIATVINATGLGA